MTLADHVHILPDRVAHPVEWRDSAACQGHEVLFFPVLLPGYKQRMGYLYADRAKEYCAACPVSDLCLDWALAMEEDTGIWGGLLPEERGALDPITLSQRDLRRARAAQGT